jgi:hypothetical protein
VSLAFFGLLHKRVVSPNSSLMNSFYGKIHALDFELCFGVFACGVAEGRFILPRLL